METTKKRPYKVDVPVSVQVWNRPDCQKKQLDILKKAAPSILFLISDGGRNPEEMLKIQESRKIMEDIDWECNVFKLYFEKNQGMYSAAAQSREFIWSKVDRCIFLEDDYIPAVSFFSFCAELLEKYKDDERIEMITGNNPFGEYSAAEPYDYFFSENGWSIWGTAYWKRTVEKYKYPFDYANSEYIRNCLKDNASAFLGKKIDNYCNGILDDHHLPGGEYYHAVNSLLFHRLSIIPTKNMIRNIGFDGAHFSSKDKVIPKFMNTPVYELLEPIKHPKYVIDDKHYATLHEKLVLGNQNPILKFSRRSVKFLRLVINGEALTAIRKKMKPEIEK